MDVSVLNSGLDSFLGWLYGRDTVTGLAEPVGRTYTSIRCRSVFADLVCLSKVTVDFDSCPGLAVAARGLIGLRKQKIKPCFLPLAFIAGDCS